MVFCAVLLCSSCCVTTFAFDNNFDLVDFLATYIFASSYNKVASDPDRLVDYWESNPGKLGVLLNLMRRGGIIPAYVGATSLNGAVDARYIAAQVDRDIVDEIYAQAQYFAGNDYRFATLDELHLSTNDDIYYDKITVTGSIPVTNAGAEWIQSISSKKFGDAGYYSVTRVDDASILCYPGGLLPPLIYVPPYGKLYQDGVLLPSNYIYVVLGDNELLQSDPGYYNYAAYYTGGDDVANDIIFGLSRGVIDNDTHNYVPSVRGERCNIYSSGLVVGQINDAGYLGWSMVDLLVKMCGFVISDGYTPPSITPPTDIPYDDDDNVVVMVPIDEPGEPVYMSPTEYNNYINNGDIYNTDDHSNNVVSNDTINNIINNYNTYDDSKVLNKLDTIIDYLKKIYKKIKGKTINTDIQFNIGDLLGVDDLFDRDSVELDWKTLVQTKLPLLAEAAEVVRKFESAESPLSIESDVPLPAGDSNKTIHFALDFTWYDKNEYAGKTGREYVREGLSYIIYVAAFVALYRRTDMLFADY